MNNFSRATTSLSRWSTSKKETLIWSPWPKSSILMPARSKLARSEHQMTPAKPSSRSIALTTAPSLRAKTAKSRSTPFSTRSLARANLFIKDSMSTSTNLVPKSNVSTSLNYSIQKSSNSIQFRIVPKLIPLRNLMSIECLTVPLPKETMAHLRGSMDPLALSNRTFFRLERCKNFSRYYQTRVLVTDAFQREL